MMITESCILMISMLSSIFQNLCVPNLVILDSICSLFLLEAPHTKFDLFYQ